MIKIGYLNIAGLTQAKHQACISLIDGGLFDILFLAETWFVRSLPYMQHPYSFVQSKYINASKTGLRSTNGILIMVSDAARNFITSWTVSQYSILLKVDQHSLLAVYLPPSLSLSQLSTIVHSFPPYDILLGDINCRFSGITQSKRQSPVPLQQFWQTHIQKTSMIMLPIQNDSFLISDLLSTQLQSTRSEFLSDSTKLYQLYTNALIPTLPSPELDHAFVKRSLSNIFQLRLLQSKPFGFPTDHQYFLHLIIDSERQSPDEILIREPVGRYYLERLQNAKVVIEFRAQWLLLSNELNILFSTTQDITSLDQALLSAVQTVAQTSLGSYKVPGKKSSPDTSSESLAGSLSSVAAIQLFKRHMRSESNRKQIVPLESNGNAMQDCISKFQSQFFDSAITSDCHPIGDVHPETNKEFFQLFTVKKVKEFIEQYPIQKACGEDSIHILLLRELIGTSFINLLSQLFIQCIRQETTPSRWNESVVYLLPKLKTGSPTANTVRPLSILPMFRRIFESLLLPAFTDSRYRYTHLHPSQAGFRKGYSTLTNAAVCHHVLSQRLASIAIFLDFKAAYDVTKPAKVMQVLKERNFPLVLQKLVYSSMFRDGRFTLRVNGLASPWLSRNQGLPQGSPLSPIIFNIFIDSLVRLLNSTVNDIGAPTCLFYADDGVIFASNISDARRSLQLAEDWSKTHEMVFNVKKCGIIITSQLEAILAQNPLVLQHEIIPTCESYQYLGFPMTINGIDHQLHLIKQMNTVLAFLKFVQFSSYSWSPYVRMVIYRTFIQPQMEYGAPLIDSFHKAVSSHDFYNSLYDAQKKSLAWVLGCSTTNYKVNEGILGVLPISKRFSHLRTLFELHRLSLTPNNPLHILLTSNDKWSTKIMLTHLRSNALYNKFIETENNDSKYRLQRLRAFLISERRQYINKNAGILVNYISPESRSSPSLVDKVISAPVLFQKTFISWRQGKMFYRSKCICGQSWTRGHISHLPTILERLSSKLQRDWNVKMLEQSKNFTVIDFLLNEGEWDLCYSILSFWRKSLEISTTKVVDSENVGNSHCNQV